METKGTQGLEIMKIPGLMNYEVDLKLKGGTGTLIEFSVLNKKRPIYRAEVMDFNEIKTNFKGVLDENDVFLPDYRFKSIINNLENQYMNLKHKKTKITHEYEKEQQNIMESLSSNIYKLNQRKIVLVGLQGAGKSSIYKVIFENTLPHETRNLKPTKGVERHSLNLYDTLIDKNQKTESKESPKIKNQIFIWDLGGQQAFMEKYLKNPENYFLNADLVIYVVDASEAGTIEKSRDNFYEIVKLLDEKPLLNDLLKLKKNIVCLFHKMDSFPKREEKYKTLRSYFEDNVDDPHLMKKVSFLATSIYDSSIHTAWTKVMQKLMPKSSKLNILAQNLKKDLNLYAAFIVEKRTGLAICSSKTLLDEFALVGSTSRVILGIERVLPEFQLTGIQQLELKTKNGNLTIIQFDEYYLLVLLHPHKKLLDKEKTSIKIKEFIEQVRNSL